VRRERVGKTSIVVEAVDEDPTVVGEVVVWTRQRHNGEVVAWT
jgi:hypothetical protein